jgi:hypothetical protein
VDAARDAETLARRYPDGRTHLITAAEVRLDVVSFPEAQGPYLSGSILNIDPNAVYVPRTLAGELPLRERDRGRPAPYQVTIGYGARWEPYVLAVSPGAASQ